MPGIRGVRPEEAWFDEELRRAPRQAEIANEIDPIAGDEGFIKVLNALDAKYRRRMEAEKLADSITTDLATPKKATNPSFRDRWIIETRKNRELKGEVAELQRKLAEYERELLVPATFVPAVNRILKKKGYKHRLRKPENQRQLAQSFAELIWYTCPSEAEVFD